MSSSFEEKVKKYMQLDKEELAKRLADLELRLECIDNTTKWFIDNIGKLFRFMKRNYLPELGILVGVTFEPVEFVFWQQKVEYDHQDKKQYLEDKYVRIRPGSIAMMEVIENREEVKKESERQ